MSKQLVTCTLINIEQRHEYLINHFGERFKIRGEALVYASLLRLAKTPIHGAYWLYYTLSDGGFYLAPGFADRIMIDVDVNHFHGELSADAAGIVATLLTLRKLVTENPGKDEAESFARRYHSLAAYATYHAEAAMIYMAID